MSANPAAPAAQPAAQYVSGNLAPVTKEETLVDLTVIGTLPPELDGRYLRNGPNPIGEVDLAKHHWFVGEGMVHGLRLADGRAHWYRNRYVRTPDVAAKLGEPAPPNPFPADRPIFAANTNVIGHAGRTFAIVEAGGIPIEMTDELDTVGPNDFGGTLELGFSAHPKRDPATGDLHAVAYTWTWGNKVQYQIIGADGRVRRAVDVQLPSEGSPMMHDLAITETKAVLFDMPCVFDLDAAMNGYPLPYRWHPEYGSRVVVLNKDGSGAPVVIDAPECYVFHPMNAYDTDDGRMVVDLVRHPRMFDRDINGPNEGIPVLERWTIDPARGKVLTDQTHDLPQEFPRVDERLVGRKHRYGYSVQIGKAWAHGGLLRHDFERGTSELRDYGKGMGTMEAVFVPRHDGAAEDDGWVMSMVHNSNDQTTELVVLSAEDVMGEPVARVMIPARVPYGFHGNWIPSGQ